jgi:CheY-like chemotaxis protein
MKGGDMKPALFALVLSDDDQLVARALDSLSRFDVQLTVCRTGQAATDFLQSRKFDLLIADIDMRGASELVDMNLTNARGYRTTVIALAKDLQTVCDLLTKRIHFAVRKPVTADAMTQVLTSACNLILIEKRVSFRHAVMINADAWVLKNGAKRPLPGTICLDISHTGLCIRTGLVLTKDVTVFVDFRLPGSEECIHTIGKVVWRDSHRQAGIRFRYVSPREFKRLRDYLNARCSWSEMLAKIPEYQRANPVQFDTRETSHSAKNRCEGENPLEG